MIHHFFIAEFFQAYDELTPMYVNSGLNFCGSKITLLGNLRRANGININELKITSLGNLKYVGGYIWCSVGVQYKKVQAENRHRFSIECFK